MKKPRGFIELTLILYIVAAIGVVSVGAYIVHSIRQGERDRLAAETAKKETVRREIISGLALDLANARTAAMETRRLADDKLKEQQDEFQKRLHDYVPAGSKCLRAGFVRYTDAAAAGVPLPAGPEPGLASAPASVGDDAEAAIIAGNYGKYHACEKRVADILSEYDRVRAVFNGQVNKINASVQH